MHKLFVIVLVSALAVAGCDESAAPGEQFGDSEWPPAATAHLDQYGILHADCTTDEDCAMVLGYFHARDRWVQMDLRRRSSTGRLTDVVNKTLVEQLDLLEPLLDVAASSRALSSTRDGQPIEDFVLGELSPKTRALFEAYAAGVNRWLGDVRSGTNGATWPAEFESGLLSYAPDDAPEWTPSDSIATVLAFIENLTNNESFQIAAGAARESIADDTRFADLWSNEPLEKSSIIAPSELTSGSAKQVGQTKRLADSAWMRRARPALARLHERLGRENALRRMTGFRRVDRNDIGSNNWALGPSLTENGNALFCNDSHLGFSQPTVWYIAHLDGKTNGTGAIHTAGLTFAGLPWVVLGQNEDIAWGATNTNLDLSDVYVEALVEDTEGNPTGVTFNGETVSFTRVNATFNFSDGSSETRELLFVPHHGPVRELDADNDIAISLRWTGNDVTSDINFLTEMSQAATVQEARSAIGNITSVGQNWVVADNQGNFGWFPYNTVPRRPWATGLGGAAPPWLPLDGTGGFEWDGFYDLSELPQTLNRATGYVATANNDFTGALSDGNPTNDAAGYFQSDVAVAFRHARIAELIEARTDHTSETLQTIIRDVHSLIGERMTPAILDIADDDLTFLSPEAQRVVNALRMWDRTCPTGLDGDNTEMSPLSTDDAELLAASGCAAFHALLRELETRIANDESSPGFPNFVTYFSVVDPSRLRAGDVYWDDLTTRVEETRYSIMSAALDGAGQLLTAELGDDETRWAWGRLHGLILQSDLASLSAAFATFNNPPPGEPLFAIDGGLYTVDVANPTNGFMVVHGASMRFCCEALPTMSCTIELPGGQSSHIDSPNYADLLPLWIDNQPIDMVFDIARAANEAVETFSFDD